MMHENPVPCTLAESEQHFHNASSSSSGTMNGVSRSQRTEGIREGQTLKRRLTIAIPVRAGINSLGSSEENWDDADIGAAACKSPKIIAPDPKKIWCSPMCTICMDDLFSFPETSTADATTNVSTSSPLQSILPSTIHQQQNNVQENLRPIIGTKCGHLFHTECINKWFMENKEKEVKECPFCKREMMANDTTRVFPIFGDDD